MKTPREILFARHRSSEPKLDAIRENAFKKISQATPRREEDFFIPAAFVASGREILHSLRWHLTAMSAVWLFALFLNMDAASALILNAAKQNTPSQQQLVAALLENRRQIAELTTSPANGVGPLSVPQTVIPRRRSEFDSPTEVA